VDARPEALGLPHHRGRTRRLTTKATDFGGLRIIYDDVLEPRPWTIAQSEWALAAGERFPLVVAVPPYVPRGSGHSVDGGADGLAVAREWLDVIGGHLTPDARVVLQIGGPQQAEQLAGEATTIGFVTLETRAYRADRALMLLSLDR
jgi:methylase of polypeptide subunit release factors